MQKRLFFKAVMILFLALLLLIPLSMISNAISERAQRRNQVLEDITKTDTGEQTLAGPVLVLPYTITRTVTKEIDGKNKTSVETVASELYFLPGKLEINGEIKTEIRHRGIFEALLYGSDLNITGFFNVPESAGIAAGEGETLSWGSPYVAVGVEDNRGIQNSPELLLGKARYAFEPGNPVAALGAGIHANVADSVIQGGRFEFAMKLNLHGTSRLGWLPMGEDTRVHVTSKWPHPSFVGRSLPRAHNITSKGFEAEWQTSHFATNMPQLFEEAVKAGDGRLLQQHVSINLVQPVDVYQQSERSVKYGILFVLLTFAAFALFEILKNLPIHPVQYGLVGIALALFFLLLIALSEHMDFGLSYGLASLACVGLLVFYLSHVLRSAWRGIGFGALLVVLYAALYGLLISEDNALLMGSILLFVLLAGVMLITRKIDWYALGETNRERPGHFSVQAGMNASTKTFTGKADSE